MSEEQTATTEDEQELCPIHGASCTATDVATCLYWAAW